MKRTLDELITVSKLPSPSAVLVRLFETMETNTAQETATIIESDPGIAARVLKLANSSVFPAANITTVRDSVVRVGMNEIVSLVMATEVYRAFAGIPQSLFDMETYWEHSLKVASLSRTLARSIRDVSGGTEWTCGLLHDVGRLLVVWLLPREYGRVRQRVENGSEQLDAERAELGYTHEQAGAYLLARWRLPEAIVGCAGNHHFRPTHLETVASVVAASNLLEHGDSDFEALQSLSEGQVDAVLEQARQQFEKHRTMFADSLS